MKVFKKLTVLALVLVMVAGLFPARSTQAAAKPAKAKVTAKANDDGKSVTLTIAKTKNADGYKIMVKKPGAKKFTKLATIKEDGTAARTYTAKKLTEGEYQFKVRAYLKSGSKTVWGKYSKVAKVKVKGAKTASTDNPAIVGVYRNDKYMIAIAKDVPAVNNYGDGVFEAIEEYKLPYGAFVVTPLYSEGFFNDIYEPKEENVLTSYTGRDDEHVVDFEFRLDGDTLYYTRTIVEDGYQEKATLTRTDEDPLDIYLTKAGVKTADSDDGKKDDKTGTVKGNLTLNDYIGDYVNSDGGSMRFYYNKDDNWYELWKIKYYANYVPYADFEDNPMNWQNYMGVFRADDAEKQSDGSYLIEYAQAYNCAAIGYTITLNADGTVKVVAINITNGKTTEAVFHK